MTPSVADLLRLCTIDPRRGSSSSSSRAPTVVHLLPTLGWGGAERLACTLHRLALGDGWRSRVDAPSMPAIDEGLAIETGVNSPPRDGEQTLRDWALAARMRIGRDLPDVVHLHLPYPDRFAAGLIAARGRPLVVTFHLLPEGGRTWSPDEIIGQRSDRIVAILARMTLRSRFVAVSRTDRDALAAWLPPRRLLAIRNAPPLHRTREAEASPLDWPAGVTRVLAIGRLVKQKGYDRLLRALADPAVRDLAWACTLVGSGPERESLGALASELGLDAKVRFAPEQSATGLFAQCDLIVSASRWEGMPLVPLEAVEAHVPILVSDIGPHREIFSEAPAT
ncbi:MAG: glycosyltransferase, partial [Deltaproteobacteria bacterium]